MSRGQAEPVRGVEPPKDPGPDEASAPRDAELDRARVAELAAENARLSAALEAAEGAASQLAERVLALERERNHAIMEADRLRELLWEVLSPSVWHEAGHPGKPCHRTGWTDDTRLAAWRDAVDGAS